MAPIDIGLTIKYYATLIFWDTLYNVVISVLFVKKAVGGGRFAPNPRAEVAL